MVNIKIRYGLVDIMQCLCLEVQQNRIYQTNLAN